MALIQHLSSRFRLKNHKNHFQPTNPAALNMVVPQNQEPNNRQPNTITPETTALISKDLIIAEFNIQRNEILKRVELQHQLLALSIIVLGTILTVGFQARSATIILFYPWLAVFLAFAWLANSRRVREMQLYIAGCIESQGVLNYIGWEWFRTTIQRKPFSFTTFSASVIFIGTEILALAAGILALVAGVPIVNFGLERQVLYIILVIISDVVCIIFTFIILWLWRVKVIIGTNKYDVNKEKDLNDFVQLFRSNLAQKSPNQISSFLPEAIIYNRPSGKEDNTDDGHKVDV